MSHSLFDGLSVVSLDGSGLTVQQLLDSSLMQNTVTIDEQSVTSTNPSVDSLNSNYTSISVIDEDLSFDDDDLFQCGRCKFEFSSLESFMVHKRSQCSSLKVKKEIATERIVRSSSSVECDPQQSGLNQVSSSFSHKVESSEDQDDKYNCDGPDSQSVVINDGEFFNLTLDGAQVFTLQENLDLTSAESEKIIEDKNGDSLFEAESNSQLTSPSLPCIITKGITDESADTFGPNIKSENSLDSTLVGEVISSENKACDYNRILFHGRMAKGDNNKEILKRKHLCMFCNKIFTKNFDLQQHIRSHTGEKPFQCIVCGRAFAQKSNVKKHMSTHKVWPKDSICHTLPKDPIKQVLPLSVGNDSGGEESNEVKDEFEVDNSYVCPFCSLVHTSYLELRSHMKEHKDQKVYRCIQKECEETFVELDLFLDHTRAAHEKEVQYRCHTCSKLFGSLHELGFHQFEHSIYPWPKKSGPSYFRCTKCMNKYASAEALDHHLKMTKHHFPCKQCSRIFSSERLLRTHLRVHGNVNLFTCSTCCKDLKSEHSLKVHQLIHTGERPFECHICSSAFNRKDKLKRHMLVHEPKKFKCIFSTSLGCHREFSRKDKLQLHLLSHTHAHSRKRTNKSGESSTPVPDTSDKTEQPSQIQIEVNKVKLEKNASLKHDFIEPSGNSKIAAVVSSPRRPVRSVRRRKGLKAMETKIRVQRRGLNPSPEGLDGAKSAVSLRTDEKGIDASCLTSTNVGPRASFDSLSINEDSRGEFMMTYSDQNRDDALGKNVEIIYIPFSLGQNDFNNKKDDQTNLTSSVESDRSTLTVAMTSSGETVSTTERNDSFFVSTEEIENLEDISAEILLTEPNLSVIQSDVTDDITDEIVVNNTVRINDRNSFFVVKGVNPNCSSDGVAISFDDTRTIILENNEDFCV